MYPSGQTQPDNYANIPSFEAPPVQAEPQVGHAPLSADYGNIPPVGAPSVTAEPQIGQAPLSANYANVPQFGNVPSEPSLDDDLSGLAQRLDDAINAVEADQSLQGRSPSIARGVPADPRNNYGKLPLDARQPRPAQRPEPVSAMETGAPQPGYLPDYKPRNAPPRPPYGTPVSASKVESAVQDTPARGTLPAYNPQNAPKWSPTATIPSIPKDAPPVRREPTADQIVVEKQQPFKENTREVSALPDRATFKGHVIAKRSDGGLILKNAESGRGGELIHLPANATGKLEASKNGGETIRNSMQNGLDGAPVQISHFKGKWSVAATNNHALHK